MYDVPEPSERNTGVIFRLGRFAPLFRAAIAGSFQLVIWPRKIFEIVLPSRLTWAGAPGTLYATAVAESAHGIWMQSGQADCCAGFSGASEAPKSTWLAVIAGLVAKSPDGAGAFAYPLLFLPFVSSAFVLTAGMPGPVRWFAEHQPVTSIVDTLRNLYAEKPLGDDVWIALAWCVGILLIAYALAVVVYRRKIA